MGEIAEKILAIVNLKYDVSFSEELTGAILKRLGMLGYTVTDEDIWPIVYSVKQVEERVENYCNVDQLPKGLLYTIADMVCGEFLYTKKQTGKLELGDLDLESAISQITEGDTSVKFVEGMSEEEKLTNLLDKLRNPGEGEFVCYRRLKW